jgi:hypothetical protein
MKVLFVLLLLLVVDVNAQDFSSPIKLDNGSLAQSRSPQVHAVRDKVYVAYFEGVLNIRFTKSIDGGVTFDSPSLVVEGTSSNLYHMMLQRAPKFVVDPSGVIHLTWTEDRQMMQGDVWYVRSTDDGKTWSHPRSLSGANDSMKYAQDFTSIACDSLGNLYVSFLDFRDEVRGSSDYGQLYMTRSTNGGTDWSEPTRISKYSTGDGGTCECCKQEIAAGATGNVYAVYRSNINNVRNIYMVRSLDKGVTWQMAKKVQDEDWEIMACPTEGPSITLDRYENLHMAWRDARNQTDPQGANRIYYDVFDYGTESSFPDREVTPLGENARWPDVIIVEDKGIWHPEIYYQSGSMNGAIKFKRFDGVVFSQPIALVEGNLNSELVSVSVDRKTSVVHAAWQEGETGTQDKGDIDYVRSAGSASVISPDVSVVQIFVLNHTIRIAGLARELDYMIFDLLGREVQSGKTSEIIDLKDMRSGVYLVSVSESGVTKLAKFRLD